MAQILCVDADWDDATRIVRQYRDAQVYPAAEARATKLQAQMARRHFFAPAASAADVKFITGSGHGLPDVFLGDNDDPLWSSSGYGAAEVQGKVIHLLSCLVAQQLGADLVTQGAQAFIGYDARFVFTSDNADDFLFCDAQVDLALFNGASVEDAHRAATTAFDAAMDNASPQDAARLEYNRDHLMSPLQDARFGDPDARI